MEEENYRWLYVDLNSYFASVEQELNPRLRGKPVIVVPVDADSSSVIAASIEAKRFGIKTGTPIYEAKKMCPQLVTVVAQHLVYLEFHHKVLQEIEKHIPIHKVYSIDEAAAQLMDNECSKEKAVHIARQIKQGIRQNVGEAIQCSIGLAPNCYLAKVATDMQKPDGLVLISLKDLPQKLYSLKLRDFPGIGANMEKRLKRFGIFHVEALCALDLSSMRKVWGGVGGERMWHFLRGIHIEEPQTKKASLSHSHVLAPELREPQLAEKVAIRMAQKIASRLRRLSLLGKSMILKLKLTTGVCLEKSVKGLKINDHMSLVRLISQMMQEMLKDSSHFFVKKISIAIYDLEEEPFLQPEFLEKDLFQKKAQNASKAIEKINQRYGKDSILLGLLPMQMRTDTKIAFTKIPDEEEFSE